MSFGRLVLELISPKTFTGSSALVKKGKHLLNIAMQVQNVAMQVQNVAMHVQNVAMHV